MRILLVDDDTSFRNSLRQLLGILDDRVEMDGASDYAVALEILRGASYERVLLDLDMPASGLDELATFRKEAPDAPVVALCRECDAQIVHAAIERGAMGFIPKSSGTGALQRAMRLLLSRGVYLPPEAQSARPGETMPGLTPLQMDILSNMIKGRPCEVVARELDMPQAILRTRAAEVLQALGARNRTEAVYAAARLGLRIA